MPDPISRTDSDSSINACYEPEPASAVLVACEGQATPAAAYSSESSSNNLPLAVQALVARAAPSSSPALGIDAGPTGVLLCRRVADIPLNQYLKLEHHFIVTDDKAAGAGHCGGGIPGHGQADLPFSPMCINDHTADVGAPGVVCEPVDADKDCVDRQLELGKYIGRWAPPFNDCQTFTASVISECSNASSSSALGAEGASGSVDVAASSGY